MSNFQRILNMASKALDLKGPSSSGGSGKTDWRDLVRTAADKVTGDSRPPVNDAQPRAVAATPATAAPAAAAPVVSPQDRAAIARYDYLLETAQPQQLEQVHRDAFARLTPAQRDAVNAQLRAELPANEYPASASPADLARSATRGEAQNPGFLKQMFAKSSGRGAGALGMGAIGAVGLGAGGLLAAVAGGAVLSTVAGPLLEQAAGLGVDFESLTGGLEGGIDGVTQGLTEGAGEYTAGLGDVAGGLGEQATGLGEQASVLGEQVSDLAANFEIPGLSALGDLFRRN